MGLRVHNSLKRQKEDFVPLVKGKVGLYVCGVTPYDLSHIGHARCYVAFDVIQRWLRTKYEVTYIRNFTDVDDKIIKRANENGEDPIALSARFIDAYHHDMATLKVQKADMEPRVSTHIQPIIDLVTALEEKGFAYRIDADTGVEGAGSDVYYRVKKFGDTYTDLSGRNLDDMLAGARIDVDDRKESPMDFALWKAAKPDEPFWDSPFGEGRPGWHIECSAMSKKHLGETFDIHGGGRDLIFPHHTNEIAQSEGANGKPYVNVWMHNGFVDFNGEKMAKSLGNFFTIREVTERYHAEALRFFLLTAGYRSPINFEVESRCPGCAAKLDAAQQEAATCGACEKSFTNDELRAKVVFPGIEEAERTVAYFYETRRDVDEYLVQHDADADLTLEGTFSSQGKGAQGKGDVEDKAFHPWQDFANFLDDDFSTPGAIAALQEMCKVANLLVNGREKEIIGRKLKPPMRAQLLQEWQEKLGPMVNVLAVGERDPVPFLLEQRNKRCQLKGIVPGDVDALIAERKEARANKDFAAADLVRDKLAALGVEVRDGLKGSTWTVH
ncbi:MAG: cysteine--tRNA ligase [Deltaproteobacteria bacterium]|nr:cysteine--tRNA ligase [Deltaproteobacteria bacterium]